MKKIVFIFILILGLGNFNLEVKAETRISVKDSTFPKICPKYSILEAIYEAKVENQIVYTRVKYKIKTWKATTIPLLSEDVAITKSVLPKDVLLLVEKGMYYLTFPTKGEYTVTIEFSSKIEKRENKNIFRFRPSRAVISKFTLFIPETRLNVEVNPINIQAKVTAQGKHTQVVAFLGTAEELKIKWSSTTASSVKPIFFSENNMLVTISPGVVRITSILEYSVMQGKLYRIKLELPFTTNLLAVKGENIKNWDLKQEGDKQILRIVFDDVVNQNYQLTLEMEEPKNENLQTYKVPQIKTVGVERQSGHIGVIARDNLKIQPLERVRISQINVNELPAELKRIAQEEISLAYRYLKQPVKLSLNIQKIKPEITAISNMFLHIDEDLIELNLLIDYDICKVGIFNFYLTLPQDYTLIDVEGEGVSDFSFIEKGEDRVLEVRLRDKVIGRYKLLVRMEKTVTEKLTKLEVPKVKVNGARKEIGYIGISSVSNIRLITKDRKNIAEIDIGELSNPLHIQTRPSLAYKYIEQPYKLVLGIEEVAHRVTAEVFTFMSVGEGLLLLDSAITYNILYAGVDEFTLAFPQGVEVVDITGENIKSKQETIQEKEIGGKIVRKKIWKIRLHSKVKGRYNLYCSYEKVVEKTASSDEDTTNIVRLPQIEILNVERESGFWCLGPRSNVEIKPHLVGGATTIDIDELPKDKARGIDVPLVLAFRYTRHPYDISIEVRKHKDVSVLVAMAESADITTVLTPEGERIVSARYMIKNKQKQYLNIILPQNANVWSAFVNNKPVKVSKTKEGHILLPLEKSHNDIPFPVEIIYETKQPKLWLFGGLVMIHPRLDIPVANISSSLYLPEEFNYTAFRGNLKLVKEINRRIVRKHLKDYFQIGRRTYSHYLSPNVTSLEVLKGEKESILEGKKAGRYYKDVFSANLQSQRARYQQFVNRKKQGEKRNYLQGGEIQIIKGRLMGALPIRVSIPTGGKLFTFNKLFSTDEELVIKAVYSKGISGKAIFWIIVVLGAVITIGILIKNRGKRTEIDLNISHTVEHSDS